MCDVLIFSTYFVKIKVSDYTFKLLNYNHNNLLDFSGLLDNLLKKRSTSLYYLN